MSRGLTVKLADEELRLHVLGLISRALSFDFPRTISHTLLHLGRPSLWNLIV